MKPISLQLVSVSLENGQQGVFVGVPLVADQTQDEDGQVEDIWFSNIQEVPSHMKLVDLIRMIQSQLCRCQSTLQ
ncbi:MAG: hypothetical protein WBN08_20340 [Thiogranum sp.]